MLIPSTGGLSALAAEKMCIESMSRDSGKSHGASDQDRLVLLEENSTLKAQNAELSALVRKLEEDKKQRDSIIAELNRKLAGRDV